MCTVVCKTTYSFATSPLVLAKQQELLHSVDVPIDARAPGGSAFATSDMVPFKARPDVVVVGAVHATSGTPARRVTARIAVGDVDKALVAHADRWVNADGIIEEGRPFTRMPLRYEGATGGPDTDNPVGLDLVRDRSARIRLPNFQPPNVEPKPPDFFVSPIGFGPIPEVWPVRRDLRGTNVTPTDRPEEVDAAYFNAAPRDQQPTELPPSAQVILENLVAGRERCVFALPGHQARALVDSANFELPLLCDTMWIDADRLICCLSWRGHFPIDALAADERVIVSIESPHQPRSRDEMRLAVLAEEASKDRPPMSEREPEIVTAQFLVRKAPDRAPSGPPAPVEATAGPATEPSVRPAHLPPLETIEFPMPEFVASGTATPFRADGAPVATPTEPASERRTTPCAPSPSTAFRTTGGSTTGLSVGNGLHAPAIKTVPILRDDASVAAAPRAAQARAGFVDVLWFDERLPGRLRAQTDWAELLQDQPTDAAKATLAPERMVGRALTRVAPLDRIGVAAAVRNAVDDDGLLVRPLVVVEGDLSVAFDRRETLRASLSFAEPLSRTDKKLREVFDAATEVASGDPRANAPHYEAAGQRVRAAFQAASKGDAEAYLPTAVERALLEERAYATSVILGARRLLGQLEVRAGDVLRVYLPEELRDRLPLLPRCRVRLVAEPHAQQTAADGEETVLVAVAVARVVQRA